MPSHGPNKSNAFTAPRPLHTSNVVPAVLLPEAKQKHRRNSGAIRARVYLFVPFLPKGLKGYSEVQTVS